MDASETVYHSLYHQQAPQRSVRCPSCGVGLEFLGLGGWWCPTHEGTVLAPVVIPPDCGPCPYSHLHVG